ncbi:hypothetical protein FA13DRAFT_1169491 [Coprinellus micaceus]|uniref:Uncharacterized protein n=1 Tax=Coprinellus micaceus TaxID=71717 RepID=A0A4Y7SU90_COPMI|nr:hypothetical protein FA13DRAFT_1169491 [Coprinellus micaceus]
MDSLHPSVPAPPPSPNIETPELGPMLFIPASTSTLLQNEEASTSASPSPGPPLPSTNSSDGTQNGPQHGAQPIGFIPSRPAAPAPAPGGPQQKRKPRIRHAMRRASFDLSPNLASTPGPSALAASKVQIEDSLKALTLAEEDPASDLEVEPPSRPGTPDSDDDTHRPKYVEPQLAEDTPESSLPIPWESKADLSQYPKMFLEDWMADLDSLPWGPDRPNPYDTRPVPYPELGSHVVAIITQRRDGRVGPAYIRYQKFPWVSEVDAGVEGELVNDGWYQGEKYVGVWLVPELKKEPEEEVGDTLEDIDYNRRDEHQPREEAEAGPPPTADVEILPPETPSGTWVPNARDAQDEIRRQATWGHRFQIEERRGDLGPFAVYRLENEAKCGDKDWYKKMTLQEKDFFAAQDIASNVKRVCRVDLQPTSEDVD